MGSLGLTEYCFSYNFIENSIFEKSNLKPGHEKMYEKKKSKNDCPCFLLYSLTFLFKFRVIDVPTKNSTLL